MIVDKPNGGVGAARNSGLKLAKGDYIYFFDPDDFIAPNVLRAMFKILENNDLEVLAFDFVDLPMGTNSTTNKEIKIPEKVKIQTGLDFIGTKNFTNECWWFITKRSMIEKFNISFMEDRLMEDVIYTQQILLSTKKLTYVPFDVYRYMTLPNSVRTSKEPKHYRKFIFDCEYTVFLMSIFIAEIKDPIKNKNAVHRLKTKQQSIVFFILLRLAKSDVSFNYMTGMLDRFKKVNAYPFTYFPGVDFKGLIYKLLVSILNSKWLRYPFLRLLRLIERSKNFVNR